MLRRLSKNQGMASFVEVLVTAIIFVTASVGFYSTVTSLRPQSADSSRRLEAAYVGKQILDDLRMQVDAGTWPLGLGGPLEPGDYGPFALNSIGGNYTLNIDVVPGTTVRQVNITVKYPG